MNRLTFRNNLGVATSNINPRDHYMDFVDKLAEYEDIGTVKDLQIALELNEAFKKYLVDLHNKMLAEFDKDGWCRLVMEYDKVKEGKEWLDNL